MNRRPIRILHMIGRMNRGGAETLIMNLYRNLNRDNVQFDFATETDEPSDYDSEILSLGGRIFPLRRPGQIGFVNYRKQLVNLIQFHGPYEGMHSHVHYFSGWNLLIARMMGIPIRIAHSHTTNDDQSDQGMRIIYRRMMKFLILSNATHLYGCSRAACESLYGEKCWQDGRVSLFRNGIDLAQYRKLTSNQSELRIEYREQFGLPAEAPIICHVGRFVPSKNHSFLFDIFVEIIKLREDAILVLIGDGPLRQEVCELAQQLKISQRVHFLGIRADVSEWLNASDLFLFPSTYEGFGSVLVEAQAVGLTCLASDVIPRDTDLGFKLVHYESLHSNARIWAERAHQLLTKYTVHIPQHSLLEQIKLQGYDILDTAVNMEKIYERIG